MRRTVLIDADIACYQIASTQEQVFDFNGRHVLHADLNDGVKELDNLIEWIIETTDSDDCILALSHPENFRKSVLPSYKENRKDQRKPMILQGLREYLLEREDTIMSKGLEGDDIIGLTATYPQDEEERVIFSIDKDLRTVPGLHWDSMYEEIITVTPEMGFRWFMIQTLTGDTTDNYKGCPGIGPVKAEKLLEGATTQEEYWSRVVAAYEKAGLTEDDALVQARCAHILQHPEYNFMTEEVTLWTPEQSL